MLTSFEQPFVQFDSVAWEDLGDGVRRKIMAYGDQLMAVYVEFRKDAIGALHAHPHLQITCVRSGAFEVQIGDERRVLRAGDFFYVPSNVKHGGRALEDCVLIDVFSPMRKEFLRAEDASQPAKPDAHQLRSAHPTT